MGTAGGKKIAVIHGPNLNLLGRRERSLYGKCRLEEIDAILCDVAKRQQVEVDSYQSNSEGDIVDYIQSLMGRADALVINPAGYTHTSVAIRDAIVALGVPTVEVHLTNIHKREPFRHRSLIADVVDGQGIGFGSDSYVLGLQAAVSLLNRPGQ